MGSRLILLLLSAAWVAACEPATTISGRARVVDGDSLEIASTSIRIFGIDAPEGRQTCTRNGASWRCGEAAAAKMRDLVGNDTIVCTQKDTDIYGRTVAQCFDGNVDLAAELARSGLALAYRQYSSDYVDEEAEAKAAGRGVWAGDFQMPWDYRRNPEAQVAPAPAPTRAPAPGSAANGDCLIKGNINRAGDRIYHVPGSSSYEQTIIDESKGERWFCSEAEARAAGWRAPRGNR